ncbi:ATP-dependent DNA helicase [Celerinatantimonas yamalensis]|uniref:ATP-dependent DNA helicase n=1 Tax=Celerinatantimonas yamalensis TaxID=559956 RepID=A0ABW9G5D2_9GAMM
MSFFKAAVRTLCELVANEGALDSRFLPAPTGLAGIMAQKSYQRTKAHDYQREVKLTGRWQACGGELKLQGRADGAGVTAAGLDYLEEVKTLKITAENLPPAAHSRHFAQLQVYAYLWCEQHGCPSVAMHLTYLDESAKVLDCQRQEYIHLRDRSRIETWFERYWNWMNRYQQLISARDESHQKLAFPYSQFRPGQRRFAAGVYRTIEQGQQLLAEAPTGIGKTLATLYPAARQLGTVIDKIVYLSAKNSLQQLAQTTLQTMQQQGAALRVITLSGKQRACLNPGAACQASCPYAEHFYARYEALSVTLLQQPQLTREYLAKIGQEQQICPYYLAMALSPWFDVIIADYNYGLDSEGSLSWLVEPTGGRYALLVDEAHNVSERARGLYSAALSLSQLKQVIKLDLPDGVAKRLKALRRELNRLINHDLTTHLLVTIAPPAALLRQVGHSIQVIEQQLAETGRVSEPLLDLYFQLYRLRERSEHFAPHYQYQLLRSAATLAPHVQLKLTCLDPAPELKNRFAKAHASVFFSATLQPLSSTAQALGLDDGHYQLCLPSPYRSEQQGVWLVSDINTRYRQREQSYAHLARLIECSFASQQRNQLVFFPSFAYLQAVAERLDERLPLLIQQRKMDDGAREQFLVELGAPQTPSLGLCVLGGIFAEGIDLPGQQLASVMIVGVGLAQFNPSNQQLEQFLTARGEDGFALVYQYPGMQRVIQAAGRVIRTQHDWGTVILVDERYRQRDYQRLLPAHWRWQMCGAAQLPLQLQTFWQH